MNVIDLTKPQKKNTLAPGTAIMVQGGIEKGLVILHSGLAELLSSSSSVEGLSAEQIIENSSRVGLIKGESVCGIMGLISPEPYTKSICTVSDCIISVMPVEADKILTLLQSNLRLNLQVLKALVQRIESVVYLFNNYKYLWHKAASIADSIALGFPGKAGGDNVARTEVSLGEYSAFLRGETQRQQLEHPGDWDHNLFLGRLQDKMGLYSDRDEIKIESLIDYPQFLFMKMLVKKPNDLLVQFFKKDEPSNYYPLRFLSNALESMLKENEKMVREIGKLFSVLLGSSAWVEEIIKNPEPDNPRKQNFIHYLFKFISRCRQDSMKLMGMDIQKEYPVYHKLKASASVPIVSGIREKETVGPQQEPAVEVSENALSKYNNLMSRILDFSDIEEDTKTELAGLLKTFAAKDKKFEMDPEINQLRADITERYWKLYEDCFLKMIATDLKNFIPGIMLHFGLFDEKLVSKEDLITIDSAYSKNLCLDSPVPVMTLPYFLEKIYNKEVNPSISEMGESFRDLLKRQERMTKKEKESAYIYEDNPEDRVRFEIRAIVQETLKLLFGSKKKALPILCREAMLGKMDRLLMDPETVAEYIQMYRQRDYSVFYREAVVRHKFGTDLAQKEVLPNFILYPVAGLRVMMWQEIDGAKRNSAGRLFLPIVCNEKKEKCVLSLLAQFRWELQKTIAGAKWIDAVEGGLVGAYYDYIQFYKKNSSLSSETKAKIKGFIKKTRSDRDRFTADYIMWLESEYEGRVKLNAATRDIFYRYVPFRKKVRAEMAKKPLYSNLEMKYQNRQRKVLLKFQSRAKKFERAGEPLPEDLKHYLEFLEY